LIAHDLRQTRHHEQVMKNHLHVPAYRKYRFSLMAAIDGSASKMASSKDSAQGSAHEPVQ
jgi:hypothetical protein